MQLKEGPQILAACRKSAEKQGLDEEQREQFIQTVSDVLEDYAGQMPADCEIRYHVRAHFGRVELRLRIYGEKFDPFYQGEKAAERLFQKRIDRVHLDCETSISYFYSPGINTVIIHSPRKKESRNILKQPMVLAALVGLLMGLVSQYLPDSVSGFLIDQCVSPIMQLILGILSGIVGPVVFLSIVLAIGSLESIEELNRLGKIVIRRFVLVTLFITLAAILISLLFFPILGRGSVNFTLDSILELIFGVIPTSLFRPFVDNNLPQLLVLGMAAGAALLLLGEKAAVLRDHLSLLSDWVYELMGLVNKLMPAIPFLSIFKLAAEGRYDVLIRGWKYIAAVFLCIAVCITVKFFKVSYRCGMKPAAIWNAISPIVTATFLSGSSNSVLRMQYETSKDGLGIEPSFSSFWIPLSYGMLMPSVTIAFVVSTFFVAGISGVSASFSFLLVLALNTVLLSLASPGLTPGTVIILESLGLDAGYAGVFSAYRIFTKNVSAAFNIAYKMLEQLEAAGVTDNIRTAEKNCK